MILYFFRVFQVCWFYLFIFHRQMQKVTQVCLISHTKEYIWKKCMTLYARDYDKTAYLDDFQIT